MDYRIIFSDIDGTLLDENREISEFTRKQILELTDRIPFVLVSARMPRQMAGFSRDLNVARYGLIAYNGALVLHQDRVLHSKEIPLEPVQELTDFNHRQTEPVHISLYHHDEWYVPQMDRWAEREINNTRVTPEVLSNSETLSKWQDEKKGAHKIMCMGDAAAIDRIFKFLKERFNDDLHLYRSKDTYIEIADKSVSKLTGIKLLAEQLRPGTSLQQIMAFGDNYNDVEMIGAVGHGVAVANARDEVKAVANAVTTHHKEDGVGRYLASFFKGNP
ncbi:HAD family hydrolase [Robertkochia aurantiaca]|uniref:HAD family hydrolase n=1 Tax=Robertkochia aurantiaca TaxID=2873700 RepID=UPI001CCB380E|nr:HAD family hydrolase [Robertkochia sp. 3YJGBD-33]